MFWLLLDHLSWSEGTHPKIPVINIVFVIILIILLNNITTVAVINTFISTIPICQSRSQRNVQLSNYHDDSKNSANTEVLMIKTTNLHFLHTTYYDMKFPHAVHY